MGELNNEEKIIILGIYKFIFNQFIVGFQCNCCEKSNEHRLCLFEFLQNV